MTKIEWSNNLSVGVDLIDDQHKLLIQKIADLAEAVNKTQGAEKILKTLGFMVEYTDFHFSAEEELMKEHDYPEMEYHLKQHKQFPCSGNHLLFCQTKYGKYKIFLFHLCMSL